jgi:hypothetical protein
VIIAGGLLSATVAIVQTLVPQESSDKVRWWQDWREYRIACKKHRLAARRLRYRDSTKALNGTAQPPGRKESLPRLPQQPFTVDATSRHDQSDKDIRVGQ